MSNKRRQTDDCPCDRTRPDPLAVAEALKNPSIKRQIDEQVTAILDLWEDEGDPDEL